MTRNRVEFYCGVGVFVLFTLLIATLSSMITYRICRSKTTDEIRDAREHVIDSLNTHRDTIYIEEDWTKLIKAIIKVESNGNPNAVGKSEDVGCMQMRPIYVKEVNRILKEERYTLDDRYDPMKTLEMFHIVQNHHNPSHDIEKAIKLHNKAGWYRDRVINAMLEI